MVILHRDEGREVVRDGIIYNIAPVNMHMASQSSRISCSLCMTWTTIKISQVIIVHKLERVRTLPSVAATHAYVPNVSRFDYIMQSLHRLLNRRIRIEAVALQDVDIIKLEAFQGLLHRIKNVLQMQAS